LDAEVDLERGDVLSTTNALSFTDQFEADLVWLDETYGFPGRGYLLRVGHQSVKATITRLFGLDDKNHKAGVLDHLVPNDVARGNFQTDKKIVVRPFAEQPELGRFVLVDASSGNTVAAGVANHTLRRADNLAEHSFDVSVADRSALVGQEGRVVWFTGLSGSGKSTLANAVSVELVHRGVVHSVLDGDSLRIGLNKDLGFGESDRVENIRRTAEVAKLMADSGLIVLVSLISPYRADRDKAREIVGASRVTEVFVDAPIEVCELRDPKGLYAKARRGLIPNFTGVDAPYEVPENPDIVAHHGTEISLSSATVISSLFD
jgi:bifunctional enzyme CysN/CysC